MSDNARVFNLLLACPDDVREEAERVRTVVDELNLGIARLFGARLEMVHWRSHVIPAIGPDVQAVINEQLPKCDILLGVMWARFGTVTPRAGSGTEEEVDRAVTRFRQDAASVRIMFYFKTTPVAPGDIDVVQLSQVQEFRERLSREGIFYGTFGEVDDFERRLRQDLGRQLEALTTSSDTRAEGEQHPAEGERDAGTEPAQQQAEAAGLEDDDEGGYIDYLEEAETQFDSLRAIVTRMTTAIEDVGGRMGRRAEEVESYVGGERQVSRQEARTMFNRAAHDMDGFAEEMEKDVPVFRHTLTDGLSAVKEAMRLIPRGPAREEQVEKSRADLVGFRDSLRQAGEGVSGFRGSVEGLPRMTKELNRAKRRTWRVLVEILDAMEGGRHLVEEALAGIAEHEEPGRDLQAGDTRTS